MSDEFWNYVLVYCVIFGFTCCTIEKNKGYRDGVAWFIWGFLFGGFALIAVCAKPAKVEKEANISSHNPYISNAGIPKVTYTGIPRVFYCPNCNSTYNSARMSRLICPDCKLPLIETVFYQTSGSSFPRNAKKNSARECGKDTACWARWK